MSHTPTPWGLKRRFWIDGDQDHENYYPTTKSGISINPYMRDNAEHIVRCVNAHDELVGLLKRSCEVMRLAADERDTLLSDESKSHLYGAAACGMMRLKEMGEIA